VQADVLDGRPDNRQATGFRRKHINLVGALAHEAPQTFNSIGGLNVSMHGGREFIKRQQVLFVLSQASHRLGIAFAVFGECSLPVVSMSPVLLVAPRCQRVQ
jgi:hypothetical protein